MMKIHSIKCEMKIDSKNICITKIDFDCFLCFVIIFSEFFENEVMVKIWLDSLFRISFHTKIYSDMSPSYMGDFSIRLYIGLIIMKV